MTAGSPCPASPGGRSGPGVFRLIRALLVLGVFAGLIAGGGLLWFLDQEGRTPREWEPYLERRADRHRSIIVDSTAMVADYLISADRLKRPPGGDPPANIGASAERSGPLLGRVRQVVSQADMAAAIAAAQPGDVIQLVPGRFTFTGRR